MERHEITIDTHYWDLKRHVHAVSEQDALLRARLRDALAKFLERSGADSGE